MDENRNTGLEQNISITESFVDSEEVDVDFPDIGGEVYTVNSHGVPIIPFNSIHRGPVGLNSLDRNCFLPGREIKVKILNYENDNRSRTNILNPNLYTIQLTHGDRSWIICRRYKHFLSLHEQLLLYSAKLHLPMPNKDHRERRRSHIQNKETLPRFPKKPEALVKIEELDLRALNLETYLYQVLRIPSYRNHPETLKFIEVSHYSFVNNLGQKSKEGLVKKRAGGRRITFGCCGCFGKVTSLGHWSRRYLIAKDSFVVYLRPQDGRIGDVILMDKDFRVRAGLQETGESEGLQISNMSRHLYLRCWTARKANEWMENINSIAYTIGKQFTLPNRFDSFVPMRVDTQANWFIDGAGYFDAVAQALENAKEEIYITDWWLSPELYLKRPINEGDKWRLDIILKRKAEEGVIICILLWKEIELAIGINSYYSKQILLNHHKNIKVLRHPDHAPGGVLYWAHHEKLVIIDQRTAFTGGLDLCFGRWDTPNHFLTDVGSFDEKPPNTAESELSKTFPSTTTVSTTIQTPGSSPRKRSETYGPSVTFKFGNKGEKDMLHVKRASQPIDTGLSPEHERQNMFLSCKTDETDASNLSNQPDKQHTPQLQHKIGVILKAHEIKNKFKESLQRRREAAARRESLGSDDGSKTADMRVAYIARDLSVKRYDFMGNSKIWIGKDYSNFIYRDFVDLDLPFEDFVDRSSIPRMPWHDIGMVVYGRAAQDLARHFIQRWNFTKLEKVKENINFPLLLPKSYEKVPNNRSVSAKSICCNCQVLRSASDWSVGIKHVETSIQNAYIHCIENAQHYIYIENQFFISISDHPDVTNGIADALFCRIQKAHRNGETFRVFVILPLLPAFEGEIGTSRGVSIQAITHWNYSSICRGGKSLIERLVHEGVCDNLQYISFCGLRTFAELGDKWVSELVYVHSKLMIIDDNTVICGSANINDRSMLGKRDSEIALLIQDNVTFSSKMNGQPFKAGQFAATLRKSLMAEHLGITELKNGPDLADPVTDEFYKNVWISRAAQNTSVFEKVFRCIPTNEVQSFQELSAYQKVTPLNDSNPEAAKEMLHKVQGHLVLFPTYFLRHENLQPPVGTRESLVPVSTWT